MKRISLKFVVGFLAFTLGVFGTALWFFNPFPSDPLKNVPIVQVENNTDEEYEVYSVLINELFVKKDTSRNSLNISSQTSFYNNTDYLKKHAFQQRVDDLKKRFPLVSEDTLADFEKKQLEPIKLQPKFNIPVQYNFISEKEVEKKGGRAASILIELSQVGFNQTRTQAFVGIQYFCPLCGFGSNVLLEKQKGVWQIKEEFWNWES